MRSAVSNLRGGKCFGAVGRAFAAARDHARVLATPTEVANAIRYVRENFAHHFPELTHAIDPFSSGARPDLAADPRTWLLRIGWTRARPRASDRHTKALGRHPG